MAQEHNQDQTKERLLVEAEKLFALKGYNAVSVREITSAADVNLAAVNYHFGSKKNLYLEVFRQRWIPRAQVMRRPLEDLAVRGGYDAAQVVRVMAHGFLHQSLRDQEEMDYHHRLIALEASRPSEAMQLVIGECFGPYLRMVKQMLDQCLPRPLAEQDLTLCVVSILAQVLHFSRAGIYLKIMGGRFSDPQALDEVVDHITRFSLGGLGITEEKACDA